MARKKSDSSSAKRGSAVSLSGEPVIRVLGDFELRREIGRGGMGVVYEAWQRSLQRSVALKILGIHVGGSDSAVTRFRREAQAAAKLSHSHIVPIYGQGEQDGTYYYAMELVQGQSLADLIRMARERAELAATISDTEDTVYLTPNDRADGRLHGSDVVLEPPREDRASRADLPVTNSFDPRKGLCSTDAQFRQLSRHLASVADAVNYAHQEGVVHRDLKPHNLLLGRDGRLRIADFGLARISESPGVTVTGEFIGSPLYMSPEQITEGPGRIDHRTDIYSLGATMYEWITLHPPFPGESRERVISMILTSEPVRPSQHNPFIPPDLETICLKAMERDLSRRYASAGEMCDDLRRFAEGKPIRARRTSILTRTRRFIERHQVASIGACSVLAGSALVLSLYSTRQTVKNKTQQFEQASQRAQVAEQQVQRLRDLLEVDPVLAMALKGAEAGAGAVSPMLPALMEKAGMTGADAKEASSPAALARRVAKGILTQIASVALPDLEPDLNAEDAMLAEAMRSDDPVEAERLVSSFLKIRPDYLPARQYQIGVLGLAKRYGEMASQALQLAASRPEAANTYVWQGLAALMAGQGEEALRLAQRAIELDGLSHWSRVLHGLALLDCERAEDALSEFEKALAGSPGLVAARLGKAAAHERLGNLKSAISELDLVASAEPADGHILALRGHLHFLAEDFQHALDDYSRATQISGGLSRDEYFEMAFALTRTWDKSPQAIEEAVTEGAESGPEQSRDASTDEASVSDDGMGFFERLRGGSRSQPSEPGPGFPGSHFRFAG